MIEELTNDAVTCRRGGCQHPYPGHDPAGGHCRTPISNSPAYRLPCMCPGFLWVDPAGPPVGSYSDPPALVVP